MSGQPQYSVLDLPSGIEKISTFEKASPWKNADTAFTWTNFDYPFYHTHEYWEVMITVEGTLNHFIDKNRYTISAGDAWIVKPSDEHKLCKEGNSHVKQLNFIIRKEYMQKLLDIYGQTRLEKFSPAELSFSLKEETLRHVMSETILIQSQKTISSSEKETRCKILIGEIFSEFIKQKILAEKPYPEWLEQLLIKLSDPFFEEGSIKTELAKNANYSYSSLIRLFKQYTGYTIIEFVSIKKIEYATELLQSSDKKILEIASMLGYDSLSHFNHLFKRYTGTTPKEYRKKHSD